MVLGLPNGDIATGSSGKAENGMHVGYKLRIYRGEQLVCEQEDHGSAIRQLALVPGVGFASASNDGSVIIRSVDGTALSRLSAGDSFVLGLCVLPTGEIAAASDDGVVNVWKDGRIVQSIAHPSSIWCVAALPNGDLATGASDKVVRVFSRSKAHRRSWHYRGLCDQCAGDGLGKLPEWLEKRPPRLPSTRTGSAFQESMTAKSPCSTMAASPLSTAGRRIVDVGRSRRSNVGGEVLDGVIYDRVLTVEIMMSSPEGYPFAKVVSTTLINLSRSPRGFAQSIICQRTTNTK